MSKGIKRPNVERMKRTLERSRDLAGDREYAKWLAGMTPEHRAVHEGRGLCSECINSAFRRFGQALRGESA